MFSQFAGGFSTWHARTTAAWAGDACAQKPTIAMAANTQRSFLIEGSLPEAAVAGVFGDKSVGKPPLGAFFGHLGPGLEGAAHHSIRARAGECTGLYISFGSGPPLLNQTFVSRFLWPPTTRRLFEILWAAESLRRRHRRECRRSAIFRASRFGLHILMLVRLPVVVRPSPWRPPERPGSGFQNHESSWGEKHG
jgi:hypothetical protein